MQIYFFLKDKNDTINLKIISNDTFVKFGLRERVND